MIHLGYEYQLFIVPDNPKPYQEMHLSLVKENWAEHFVWTVEQQKDDINCQNLDQAVRLAKEKLDAKVP